MTLFTFWIILVHCCTWIGWFFDLRSITFLRHHVFAGKISCGQHRCQNGTLFFNHTSYREGEKVFFNKNRTIEVKRKRKKETFLWKDFSFSLSTSRTKDNRGSIETTQKTRWNWNKTMGAYLELSPCIEFLQAVDGLLSMNHRCDTFTLLQFQVRKGRMREKKEQ